MWEYSNVISNLLIFILKKERLLKIVETKTKGKCFKVDKETERFLSTSTKLRQFKKEQFDKHQVYIEQELADRCSIWIVCEKSKMSNAEKQLKSLTDKNRITSYTFALTDLMKLRFLREYRWSKIQEKETRFKVEGVVVLDIAGSFVVKGTEAGINEMMIFLNKLAGNIVCKVCTLSFCSKCLI